MTAFECLAVAGLFGIAAEVEATRTKKVPWLSGLSALWFWVVGVLKAVFS